MEFALQVALERLHGEAAEVGGSVAGPVFGGQCGNGGGEDAGCRRLG